MLFELKLNDKKKGNFLLWEPTKIDGMSELDYHVQKLREAIAAGNLTSIQEYCADIGNIVLAIEKSPRIIQRNPVCPPYRRPLKPSAS